MPFATVQSTRERAGAGIDHVTFEQKPLTHKGIADLLFEGFGNPPGCTWIAMKEVALEDRGQGGGSVLEYGNQLAERAVR